MEPSTTDIVVVPPDVAACKKNEADPVTMWLGVAIFLHVFCRVLLSIGRLCAERDRLRLAAARVRR